MLSFVLTENEIGHILREGVKHETLDGHRPDCISNTNSNKHVVRRSAAVDGLLGEADGWR